MKLEGLYRQSGVHAAGVVIGDRPLDQLVPLYKDPKSDMPVTQYDMKYVEETGLIKFDFLGLKTLTVIKRACDWVKKCTALSWIWTISIWMTARPTNCCSAAILPRCSSLNLPA